MKPGKLYRIIQNGLFFYGKDNFEVHVGKGKGTLCTLLGDHHQDSYYWWYALLFEEGIYYLVVGKPENTLKYIEEV